MGNNDYKNVETLEIALNNHEQLENPCSKKNISHLNPVLVTDLEVKNLNTLLKKTVENFKHKINSTTQLIKVLATTQSSEKKHEQNNSFHFQRQLTEKELAQLAIEEKIFKEFEVEQHIKYADYINHRLIYALENLDKKFYDTAPDSVKARDLIKESLTTLKNNQFEQTQLKKTYDTLHSHPYSNTVAPILKMLEARAFINELQVYINQRWATAEGNNKNFIKHISDDEEIPNSFFRRFHSIFHMGYSAGDKISAARKLKLLLHYDSNDSKKPVVTFTAVDIKALRNSQLGKIVRKYEYLLPQEFKQTENPKPPIVYVVGPHQCKSF